MPATRDRFRLFVFVNMTAFLPLFMFETKVIKKPTTDRFKGQVGESVLMEETCNVKVVVVQLFLPLPRQLRKRNCVETVMQHLGRELVQIPFGKLGF
jgi:hypothetical protein